jgi:NAD(P)-dependent dehydrogenase (short-subunit alcohol dehydrogenase family)
VLVTGASGGVGRFAVQLAHIGGAHVSAVSANPERARGLTDLGADEVLHELTPEGPEFDVIVEGVGGASLGAAIQRVAADGTVVSFANSDPSAPTEFPTRSLFGRAPGARLYGLLVFPELAKRRGATGCSTACSPWSRPGAWTRTSTSRRAGASPARPSTHSSTAASPARPSSTSTDGDRVALVTGANRGIGLEVCRQLAQRGYVVLLGARDAARGARAARQLGGRSISPIVLDVADDDSVRAAASGLDRLDVLVNNAAILYDTWQRGIDADLDQVREAFETNLLGAWRTTQAVLPPARQPGGAHRQRLQRRRGAARHGRRHARLSHVEGRAQRADARPRRRAALRRHPRQRRLPRLGGDRHGRLGRASGGRGRGRNRVGRDAAR